MKTASDDLWRRTISQIPSIYGRLVYLGRLRNSDTGRYEHHGLAAMFDANLADSALRESHLGAFREWLVVGDRGASPRRSMEETCGGY